MKKQTINIINISPEYSAIWKCGYYILNELKRRKIFNVNFIDLHSHLPRNILKRYFILVLRRLEFYSTNNDINFYISPLASSLITGIPAKKNIVLIHDFWPVRQGSLIKRFFFKYMYRKLPEFDLIISNSKTTENEYLSIYPHSNILKTVHLGIDNIYLTSNTDSRINSNSTIDNSEITFISIGRDEPRKNIKFILDLSLKLKLVNINFKLIRVGNFSQQNNKLINQYNLNSHVVLYTNISENELVSLYTESDYLLFPSLYEGFGFPVLEAAACGCIPLTSKFGSVTEIIPDKDLCLNLNTNDWLNKIISFETSKLNKKNMIDKCINHAKQFSWKVFLNKLNFLNLKQTENVKKQKNTIIFIFF